MLQLNIYHVQLFILFIERIAYYHQSPNTPLIKIVLAARIYFNENINATRSFNLDHEWRQSFATIR